MKHFCIFLISISLSVFYLVNSDLYFGTNKRECYVIDNILEQIDVIYNTSEVNRTSEDFRKYIAYNPQQCHSRYSNVYKCCLVKIKSNNFGYNFCGQVQNENYSDIPKVIEDIRSQGRNFTQSKNDIKIDCESNYKKIFSFAVLLLIVLIL